MHSSKLYSRLHYKWKQKTYLSEILRHNLLCIRTRPIQLIGARKRTRRQETLRIYWKHRLCKNKIFAFTSVLTRTYCRAICDSFRMRELHSGTGMALPSEDAYKLCYSFYKSMNKKMRTFQHKNLYDTSASMEVEALLYKQSTTSIQYFNVKTRHKNA